MAQMTEMKNALFFVVGGVLKMSPDHFCLSYLLTNISGNASAPVFPLFGLKKTEEREKLSVGNMPIFWLE